MQMNLHHEDINEATKALGAMSKRIEVITVRAGGRA